MRNEMISASKNIFLRFAFIGLMPVPFGIKCIEKNVSKTWHSSAMKEGFKYRPPCHDGMATLNFDTLLFHEEGSDLVITLLNLFELRIPTRELDCIGLWSCTSHAIIFKGISDKKAAKFHHLFTKYLASLKNKITGRPAIYIHQNSGIPLFGNLYFGITDKGSDIIEVKPITGCNASCIFCSVGEGPTGNRGRDFVVEEEYLARETVSLLDYKKKPVTVYINPHGEPLLYADLPKLVEDTKKSPYCRKVVIITNGMMLSFPLVDKLAKAGLDQINLSLSSTDAAQAKRLMGTDAYRIERIMEFAKHIIGKTRIHLTINPVYLKGINDDAMDGVIKFAKSIGCGFIGIQNYIRHDRGKRIADELSWDAFEQELLALEKKHGVTLVHDTMLEKTRELPVPFRRGDVIAATIMCPGRIGNEHIVVAKGRSILVRTDKERGNVNVRIKRSLHNIFVGEVV